MTRSLLFAVALLTAAVAPAAAACDGPEYHQWDFWVGSWRVTNSAGKVIGHDVITRILGGCAVREEYRDAADSGVGIGTFAYDSGARHWRHFFSDDSGFVLVLEGGSSAGVMVLEGTDYPNGRPRLNRGTWSVHGDAVEELWQRSTDGGKTWQTRFDGWFRRMP